MTNNSVNNTTINSVSVKDQGDTMVIAGTSTTDLSHLLKSSHLHLTMDGVLKTLGVSLGKYSCQTSNYRTDTVDGARVMKYDFFYNGPYEIVDKKKFHKAKLKNIVES